MTHQPFFIPAVLFLVVGLPLVLGLVPRNRFYGFRTPRAMQSDRDWYRINRVAGVLIGLASVTYLTVARLAPTTDQNVGFDLTHPHFQALMGPRVAALVLTSLYARRG